MLAMLALLWISTAAVHAQFGQNKVQYQRFHWNVLSSDHFDVYFDEGLDTVARVCAYNAEQALIQIEEDVRHHVASRQQIILYASHIEYQQTNVIPEYMPEGVRGVTELFKNRVVVNFEGNWELFRQLIHHELTHAVLNDMLYFGNTRYFFQSRVQFPLWMNEGLAEFECNHGMDAESDMFMRDVVLQDQLPPLDQLDSYFAYKGGQAFWDYVSRTYGRAKIADVLQRVRIGMTLDAVFRACFGLDLRDFSERWLADMKREYYPDLERFNRLDDFAVRLSNHDRDESRYNSSPAISPDGSRLAFLSFRNGGYGVYVQNLEQRWKPQLVVNSRRSLDFEELNVWTPGISWDPKGTQLAISAKAGGEDVLSIVNVATGEYTMHKFGMKAMSSVAWSPDGKRIAFSATVGAKTDLYVFDLKSATLRQLTKDSYADEHPLWSSDSRRLYFISDREGDTVCGEHDIPSLWTSHSDRTDIYVLNLDSMAIRRLTFDARNHKSSFCLSRDNDRLLYVSDENGIGNIYELNVQSGLKRPVTNSLSGIGQVSLSRDDAHLCFSAQNQGTLDIWMLRHPLDQSLNVSSLPLTKLRQRENRQASFRLSLTVDSVNEGGSEARQHFKGFGHFDIDAKRQAVEEQPVYSNDSDGLVESRLGSAMSDVSASTVVTQRTFGGSAVQDPSHYPVHAYKPSITSDYIVGGVGYNGLWNNGQLSIDMMFSDVLGDHVITGTMQLWNDLRNSNLSIGYYYQPEIIDYSLEAYHNAFLSYLQTNDSTVSPSFDLYSLQTYGVRLGAKYAWNRYERIEGSLAWIGVDKFNESVPELSGTNSSLNFAVPSARYVFDNSEWGFFAPYNGTRALGSVTVSPLTRSFVSVQADIRQYLPLWKQYYGFAFRAAGGTSMGADPRPFFLGGVENWIGRTAFGYGYDIFNHAEDFAFLNLETPLRGFDIGQLAGRNFVMANAEFRFPFFSGFVAVPLPFVLLGSVFADLGTAWNGSVRDIALRSPQDTVDAFGVHRYYSPGSLLLSAGVGLRSFLAGYPLKVDIAWRREGNQWSDPSYIVSIGYDF